MSEKNKITDSEALEALNSGQDIRARIATTQAPRSVFYGVEFEYQPGVKTKEIRCFLRQGEQCSPSQWAKAEELEKEFSGLNKKYQAELKASGKQVNVKINSNPLRAIPLDLR